MTLDGRVIDVLMTATRPGLITEPDMSVMGIIDITERVRAQEMLQRVQADFAHAARVSMLGELTASIAHEVNQPLAAIAINGDVGLRLLDRSEPDLAEMRELTKCIVDDARRAADVIARFARWRRSGARTDITVDRRGHPRGPAVSPARSPITWADGHASPQPNDTESVGDRTQLQQVFVNLTVNAIQAMAQTNDAPDACHSNHTLRSEYLMLHV